MHLKRWITGIVALPLLLLLIFKGGPFLFVLIVWIISLLSLWEYFRIVFIPGDQTAKSAIPFIAFILSPFILWFAYKNSFDVMLGIIMFNLMISGLISLILLKPDTPALETITKQVLGVIYIPFFLAYLVLIRNSPNGEYWIFFLLAIVFTGDTCAFYVGSYLGKHKLCPLISPGKTIEGAVGGLVSNLGAGSIIKWFFFPLLPWATSIMFFLFIGAAGQVGDLFESAIKRSGNIKDSGGILPGHGGMLDRIDALLFAAPVAYFFKQYVFY